MGLMSGRPEPDLSGGWPGLPILEVPADGNRDDTRRCTSFRYDPLDTSDQAELSESTPQLSEPY